MKTRKCQHRTALELFDKVGATVTPQQIDKHVGGTGSYYSKHMSVLRRWGFEFSTKKDGREIISYTLLKEPADAASYRSPKTIVKKTAPKKAVKKAPEKKAPVKKEKTVKTPVKKAPAKKATSTDAENKAVVKKLDALREKIEPKKTAKQSNLQKIKEVATKRKEEKEALKATPAASSFSVDPDWDSVEDVDISALV